jgi:hypothetical protein
VPIDALSLTAWRIAGEGLLCHLDEVYSVQAEVDVVRRLSADVLDSALALTSRSSAGPDAVKVPDRVIVKVKSHYWGRFSRLLQYINESRIVAQTVPRNARMPRVGEDVVLVYGVNVARV